MTDDAFLQTCLTAAFPDRRAGLLAAERMPAGLNELWRLGIDHAGARLDPVLRRHRHGVTWHADGDRAGRARGGGAGARARARAPCAAA